MENKTELQRMENVSLATANQFTVEQVSIIKATVAKGTSDLELSFFLNLAKSLNLNPFNKEIWCYKDNKGNLLAFAGRDGFLKIAQDDSKWNGMYSCEVREKDEYIQSFTNGVSNAKHIKSNEKSNIKGAFCFIKPKGCDTATIEYADFDTYNKGQFTWKSHPADMIKKVAEIKALKKAFGIAGLHDEQDFTIQNDKVIPIDTEMQIDAGKYVQIENLLRNCSIGEDEICQIEKELENGISTVRADELVYYLNENQIPPLQRGRPSAKEIRKEVDKKVNETE